MKESLEELLVECERLHGHLCPGQVLGARMARLGCQMVGVGDPRGVDRKKLIVWVEIDRCMADAVGAVTGARLGRRSLKFVDYGKVAATFFNTEACCAVRVSARDDARDLADARYRAIGQQKERQMRAYLEALDEELFKVEPVIVQYGEMDAPGRPRSRIPCAKCGEGVNDGREVKSVGGDFLCLSCAGGGYYRRLGGAGVSTDSAEGN